MSAEEIARVEASLGFERVICDLCGATLATYADKCSVRLDVQCPGFATIEQARQPTPGSGGK